MKMTNPRRFVIAAVLTALSFGCASSYTPREPGRISVMGATGRPILVKDGKTYGMSGLSSDPVDAVAGNPAAEDHARTYVRRTRTGMLLLGLGFGVFVGGVATHTNECGHAVRNGVATGLVLGSLGFLIASLATMAIAPGHLYDAINIYNDSVPAAQPR